MDQTHSSPRSANPLAERLRRIGRAVTNPDKLCFYFVLAFVLTFVVESLSRRSPLAACVFLFERPLAFLCNYGIILFTILPALLFSKRVAAVSLLSSVWLLLGVTQCIVLLSRVTPLTGVDIAVALSVMTIITSYLTTLQIILICVGLLALVACLVWIFIRARKRPIQWKKCLISLALVPVVMAAVIGCGFATGQISDQFPNLAAAYNDYGFPYCFGLSVVDKGVERPPAYGEELITDILEEITTEEPPADEVAPAAPNVIFVQLESFFDVGYLEGVTFTENPTPTFTALKEAYPSGFFTVPVIGAGTVNTEFEVLSGMSVADFGAGEYPYRSIISERTCETVAYDFLRSGYHTHAIHNHEGSFYLRNDIYKNLGFEAFTSIEYFKNPTFNDNNWAHDALLTDEILYILSSTPESDFVFTVSVQGHGKYPDEYLPAEDDVTVVSGMEDEAVRSHYNYYVNQLREMDAFIKALYEAVMALEEDTVLVFYGDHLPSIARDEGITLSMSEFETEYIIISNYGAEDSLSDEDIHAYQIFPIVMEMIGNDEGIMNLFHRTYRHDPQYLTLLEALEYDILYGEHMVYGDDEYPVMEDMVMGSRPIEITACYPDGDYLYVKGTNFTGYSVVTINGRAQNDTEFLDESTLRVPLSKNGDTLTVTVCQVSDVNEVLSETLPFVLRGVFPESERTIP